MKNFVVVGVQRTGSSALAESIGLHPRVASGWEWTQRVPWVRKLHAAELGLAGDFSWLPLKERNHMEAIFDLSKEWIGYRRLFRASDKWIIHPCLAPALWADRLEEHICWLRRRRDIHVIHIVRRDSMEWLKSVYVARRTNFYVGKKYPQGVTVKISIPKAVRRLRTKNWVDFRLATLTRSNPYLRVFYEDLFQDRKAVGTAALHFLKCNPDIAMGSEARIQKQSSGTAADYILNYSELAVSIQSRGLSMSPIGCGVV